MPHWIIEPGFFANEPVRVALVVALAVSISSALVGLFVVVRAQSFAGHALSDVATAGGAGASAIGAVPIAGFLVGGLLGAGAIEAIGVARVRGRDAATGIVLGAATGAAALFFHLASTSGVSSASTQQVLFGSIFTVPASTVPAVVAVATGVVLATALSSRVLLLASVSDDLAAARGVRVRALNWWFISLVGVVVALASVVVGSVLSTALLVGPPATAVKLTRSVRSAALAALGLGLSAAWLGVLLSYDSYEWGSAHRAVPASCCIVAVVVAQYALAALVERRRGAR